MPRLIKYTCLAILHYLTYSCTDLYLSLQCMRISSGILISTYCFDKPEAKNICPKSHKHHTLSPQNNEVWMYERELFQWHKNDQKPHWALEKVNSSLCLQYMLLRSFWFYLANRGNHSHKDGAAWELISY